MAELHAVTDTSRLAKAMSHPVRLKSLEILNQRVASPSDIARELDLPVANVSYHVTTLLRLKVIEEVETRHVRGAIEHLYRAVRRPMLLDAEWGSLSVHERAQITEEAVGCIVDDLVGAARNGALDQREDRHVSFSTLRLDQEGWDELKTKVLELLEAALGDVQARSIARLADGESGGPEVAARLSMALYEHRHDPAEHESV